jgi:uncharacterized protein (DUF305 family)
MNLGGMMGTLKNKMGAEFEKDYLEAMIKHHKDGVEMMEMAEEKIKSPKLMEMNERLMKKEKMEIEEMQMMKDEM